MGDKLVVIFIEGDTEEEFYKKLIKSLRQKSEEVLNRILIKNIKGVGNYKSKVVRIFNKCIKRDYPNYTYEIIFCYDTDAFELISKPLIDWEELITELRSQGASNVKLVPVRKSIEDWFLYDFEGVCKYLRLPKSFKSKDYRGLKGLKMLFNKANRVYVKGSGCEDLVQKLDIEKIFPYICKDISVICKAVGIDCKNKKLCK